MKVFIAGPRAINEIDTNVCMKLKNICEKKYDVLVGDAYGIDSSIQKFLSQKKYKKVTVFASKGMARNNYGNWKVEDVKVNDNVKGFDFYVQKDLTMVKNTDIGFMIWNGESKGTFNNIINLLKLEKEVILYYVPTRKFYHFKQMSDLDTFLEINVKLDTRLKKLLAKTKFTQFIQARLF